MGLVKLLPSPSELLRKANAQPALNILRLFVERFVANEIKTLRDWPMMAFTLW